MTKTAFVFPGQGSQSLGMADDWLNASPQADALFRRASEILDHDLKALVHSGPQETLDQTQWTQPALLVTSVAAWRAWQESGAPLPDFLAGHSLGEYSALVCANALNFDDAVALVHKRGRYMQEAVPDGQGAMAAVLGLEDAAVEAICQQAGEALNHPGAVSPANYNSPGQVVVSGTAEGVEKVAELARAAGAKRVIPLAVSVPSHCQLMRPAAEKLAADLQATPLQQPEIPVLHNVSADMAPSPETIRELLAEQLYSPVQWTKTMQRLRDEKVSHVVECGPGKVLCGLFKRFDRRWPTASLQSPGDIAEIQRKWSEA